MNIPKLRALRRHTAALCGLWLCAPLGAQVIAQAATPPAIPSPIPAATLAQALALAEQTAAVLAPPGARVQAQATTLDPRLNLAPCTKMEPYVPSGVPAWGRTRVGLRCTEGRTRWNVLLPLTVQVWAPAAVAAGALPAGTRLATEHLVLADVDWSAGSQAPLADLPALAGRTLARAVAPGQPLHDMDLQARQWFVAGETVRVVTVGGGFSVTAEGRALNAGVEGRPVRVLIGEDRVVVGRPVGEHRVEVSL